MKPLNSTERGSLNLRSIRNGSCVMIDFSAAASSTKVPVSFSSVMIAETRESGSSMNGFENAFRGSDAHAPSPSRLRISVHRVPLPLLPLSE